MSIKEERKKLRMTQRDLADALGVTPAAVCQWEKGTTAPRKKQIKLLSLIFRCPEDELVQEP